MAARGWRMFRKNEKSPDVFWREYEEKTGEKVLARSLGQYISGWEEFDGNGWNAIWGLVIVTSGGFRFHHFPQAGWMNVLFNPGAEAPREKTFLVPKGRILSAGFRGDTKWWKRIFGPGVPQLAIRYRNDAGEERELLLETEYRAGGLVERLNEIIAE